MSARSLFTRVAQKLFGLISVHFHARGHQGLVPFLLILVGLFFIPESPRWLALVGCQKEFESSLHRLRDKNGDILQESEEIQASIDVLLDQPKVRMLDLFDTKYVQLLLV